MVGIFFSRSTGEGIIIMGNLQDRVAVVTGASRGIGRAIALELGQRGATVVVNYVDREVTRPDAAGTMSNAEAAAEVVSAIEEMGGRATATLADVSSFTDAAGLIESAIEAYGQLDILVNNAGITRDMLLGMMSEGDWDAVIGVNLKSVFNCAKAAVRPMMRRRYGRIINISSVAGIAGNAGQTNYSASKAGIIGFTKALAREVGSRSITVNAIAPGLIGTDLTEDLPENIKEASLAAIPLGRWGKPEEIACAVAFLASDEAAYITGHVLTIDGGLTMG
jgi:3-oxoacyl-[acyl-carrier protein] reductase